MNWPQLLEPLDINADSELNGQDESAQKKQQAPKRRVMIVDDEQNILSALKRLLRREPYHVETYTSADDAVNALESQPAELVISDYRMPGLTGIEFLREVRRRWPDTVRIILTGYAEVSVIIAAVNEGEIYKFITKPWNDEEIKLHIRRAIEQYELAAENRKMAREIMVQNRQLLELNRKLDQRAADASIGLGFAQELLETIDVAVMTIDDTNLVVGANRNMRSICSDGTAEVVGVPLATALPQWLYKSVFQNEQPLPDAACGCVKFNGIQYQWRLQTLQDGQTRRGYILTLWKDVLYK